MATIKAYTDIEQSRNLAKILPLESADMWWSRCTIANFGDNKLIVSYSVEPCNISKFRNTDDDIPCWSLATLLNILPKGKVLINDVHSNKYKVIGYNLDTTNYYDEPLDACYEMILKLHEMKKL